MTADPTAKAVADLNRTLKETVSTLTRQQRILETLNLNLVEFARLYQKIAGSTPGSRQIYGWNTAAVMQIDGTLKQGDMKYEQDDSIWFWTGEKWERVELPSLEV